MFAKLILKIKAIQMIVAKMIKIEWKKEINHLPFTLVTYASLFLATL